MFIADVMRNCAVCACAYVLMFFQLRLEPFLLCYQVANRFVHGIYF